jgi:hypothetical protein
LKSAGNSELLLAEGDRVARESVVRDLMPFITSVYCYFLEVPRNVWEERLAYRCLAKNIRSKYPTETPFVKSRVTMCKQLRKQMGAYQENLPNVYSAHLTQSAEKILGE